MKHKDYYDDSYIKLLSNKLILVNSSFNQGKFEKKLIGNLHDKELFSRFDLIVKNYGRRTRKGLRKKYFGIL